MTDVYAELAAFLKMENPEEVSALCDIKKAILEATVRAFEKGVAVGEGDMPPGEYRQAVLFTESMDFEAIHERLKDHRILRLLHGGYGMATEAAELLDATKKHVFYGTPLDETDIKEEVGDSDWYREVILDAFGWTDAEVKRANINKLRRRYPNGFTREDADNRDLSAERRVLEGDTVV
jgi:hypothetical protein